MKIFDYLQSYMLVNLDNWFQYSEVFLCLDCEKELIVSEKLGEKNRYCNDTGCPRYGLVTQLAIKKTKK
jgi:hypothetical protein